MIGVAVPLLAIGIAAIVGAKPVKADAADDTARRERCAIRLSAALLGKSPSAELLAAADPQATVDAMVADPAFVERFSRFANSKFNADPGATSAEDASYHLTKYVLENAKPWKDLFVGGYDVGNNGAVTVNAAGLGYFRSVAWMRRYAGNELAGYRINSAYRILQNTTGLSLKATTNVDGVDLTAAGRAAPACAGCHYDNWYALDKVSKILSKRQGEGAQMRFIAPTEGPQQILGGKMIADDKQLVEALVASENFKVNACRLAFGFVYGRNENTCESAVFDKCATEFASKGTIQASIAAVAKDPSFCQ